MKVTVVGASDIGVHGSIELAQSLLAAGLAERPSAIHVLEHPGVVVVPRRGVVRACRGYASNGTGSIS